MVRAALCGLRLWLTMDQRTNDTLSVLAVCETYCSNTCCESFVTVATYFCYDFTRVLPVNCAVKSGPCGCGKLTHNLFLHWFYIIPLQSSKLSSGMCYLWKKIFFETSPMGHRSSIDACKHNWKWDDTYRYLHIELIYVCQWSNISKTMLVWNGQLVLLVLMAGFPWNMARPQLHLL